MKFVRSKLFLFSVDAPKMRVPSVCQKISLFAVVISMMCFAGLAAAADITACDLIDKNAAGELLGRPISNAPSFLRLPPSTGRNETNCTFRYDRSPFVFLQVVLIEFKSQSEATKWIDMARVQPAGKTDLRVVEEQGVGEMAVWWQVGVISSGYQVRKGNRVVSFEIRGSAMLTGSEFSGFRVPPELRAKLRETMRRVVNKL
jgi:hypothetical protein